MRIGHFQLRKVFGILSIIVGIISSPAYAECTINVQSVMFGNYDVFDNTHLDGAGNVNVVCDVATSYAISLSPGNGNFTNRIMLNGQNELVYNLFVDPARTIIWGDGTGSSATVSGGDVSANYTIYSRIPARQNVLVGSYQDNVTVTLAF